MSRFKRSRKRRVAVCLPMMDMVNADFMQSLVGMVIRNNEAAHPMLEWMRVMQARTSILPWARQFLAQSAIEAGATHLLWLDSDMTFPHDLMLRWIDRDEPVIGANCVSRRPPFRTTALDDGLQYVETTKESSGLQKVRRCGMAVVWHSAELLKQMEKPWFPFEWVPDKGVYRGEDYVFFDKLGEMGVPVHVDHDVSKEVRHIGFYGFSPLMRGFMGATEGSASE